jgi:F-type H+-transporting ATPase subunit a
MPLATDEGGGFHAPTIADFFPDAVLFEGTAFEFNRLQLVRLIAAVVLIVVFVVAARRAKLVPGRFQNVIEMILDFVRINVAEEVIGKEKSGKYVALLTTMFCAVRGFSHIV